MDDLPAADVVSFNADTRRVSAAEATVRMGQLARELSTSGLRPAYVKIDSTLRGHPGAEIGVTADAIDSKLVIVAPSFPETGRTVIDGNLLVHDSPLHETEVGRDPLSPVGTSRVSEILKRDTVLPVFDVPLDEIRSGQFADRLSALAQDVMGRAVLAICDAETDADLDAITAAGLTQGAAGAGSEVLFAGSAGLAASLARAVQIEPNNNVKTPGFSGKPVLVFTASQRTLADDQIAALEHAGLADLLPVRMELNEANEAQPGDLYESELVDALNAGHNVALRVHVDADLASLGPAEVRIAADSVTQRVGKIVASAVSRANISGLVIIGGDTAHAVLSAVGARGIFLAAEPLAGVALGAISGGTLDGVTVATKAGAFGDEQTLVELFRKLQTG